MQAALFHLIKFCVMRSVKFIVFQAGLVRSFSPDRKSDYALANCSMELFLNEGCTAGHIEWLIRYRSGGCDVIYIGLQFDNLTLSNVDCYSPLPSEAVALLRDCGFRVPFQFSTL